MHSESFEEIFTYVGPAPEMTPEEREEELREIEEMRKDLHCQIQRIKMGIRFNGTRYDGEDLKRIKEQFGEITEPTEEDLKRYQE
jgi:hypothetical protein